MQRKLVNLAIFTLALLTIVATKSYAEGGPPPADATPGAVGFQGAVLAGLETVAAPGYRLVMAESIFEPGAYLTRPTHPTAIVVCVQSVRSASRSSTERPRSRAAWARGRRRRPSRSRTIPRSCSSPATVSPAITLPRTPPIRVGTPAMGRPCSGRHACSRSMRPSQPLTTSRAPRSRNEWSDVRRVSCHLAFSAASTAVFAPEPARHLVRSP
jgi:hypothetical protein